MLSHKIKVAARLRRQLPGTRPLVLAVFSYRYDAHLVPDLLENLAPVVDGWVAYDDRGGSGPFTSEPERRQALIGRARALGAAWVLAIDPDERLEHAAAARIRELTRSVERIIWCFDLREMYTPDHYRVDGIWGSKSQARLFPLLEGQVFSERPLHGPWSSIEGGYAVRPAELNLYHLKMIDPARRAARRDLYKRLDPGSLFQRIGYDYLTDEAGLVLEPVPPSRSYWPRHVDDRSLWMAPPPNDGRMAGITGEVLEAASGPPEAAAPAKSGSLLRKSLRREPVPETVLGEYRDYSEAYPESLCAAQSQIVVAACRDWIAESESGRVAAILLDHIDRREPFSLIRIGDGEGNFLFWCWGRYPGLADFCLRRISRMHVGSEALRQDAAAIGRSLVAAIAGADILGLSDLTRLHSTFALGPAKRGDDIRGACGIRGAFHFLAESFDRQQLAGTIGTGAFIHHTLSPHYGEIIGRSGELVVISPYPALARLIRDRWSGGLVEAIPVPLQANKANDLAGSLAHYPLIFDRVVAAIRPRRRGAVYLVAAGILAKLYCQVIKDRGGIAIDIGSFADVWMGRVTRPEMLPEQVARWRLNTS